MNLTEATLAFGRAEEPPPKLERVRLADIAEGCRRKRTPDLGRGARRRLHHLYMRCSRATSCCAPIPRQLPPRPVEPRAQRAAGHRGHGQARQDPDRGTGKGNRLADRGVRYRARSSEKRRSITSSSRSTAARAREAPASASRSRRRSCGGMAARSNWCGPGRRARPSPSACRQVSPSETPAAPGFPLHGMPTGAKPRPHAPVAQLDRVLDYESRGRGGFESSPVAPL